jgi:hypothetical protein
MTELDERDRRRRRWAMARRLEGVEHGAGDSFATGGLGGSVEALGLRMLVLPEDPMADAVPLDRVTAEWLNTDQPSPYGWHSPELGSSKRATSDALVRYDQYREDQRWSRYLALHRHGGLDLGVGSLRHSYRDWTLIPLRQIVGLVWHVASLQVDAIARWEVAGPIEVTLALPLTSGVGLTGFAEGWNDVGRGLWDPPTCIEESILLRFERDTLDPEELAMTVGDRIENSFGGTHQRHLANRGEFEGRFDPR